MSDDEIDREEIERLVTAAVDRAPSLTDQR